MASLRVLTPVQIARGFIAEEPYVLDMLQLGAYLGALLVGAARAPGMLPWAFPTRTRTVPVRSGKCRRLLLLSRCCAGPRCHAV